MIWSILFFWLASNTNSILMPSDFKDYVKKDIDNKELREDLLQDIDLFEKELADFEKVKNDWNKSLDMANIDFKEPTAGIDSIFQAYIILRSDFDVYAISAHLSLKSKISDSDWKKIIQDVDASQKKLLKKQTKQKENIAKDIKKIRRKIDMMVIDPEKRKNADVIFDEFATVFLNYMDETYVFNYQQNEILRNRTATEEEVKNLVFEVIEIREAVFKAYVKMNSDLFIELEQTEWKRITRAVNEMI